MDSKAGSSVEAEGTLSLHCTLLDSSGLIHSGVVIAVLNGEESVFSITDIK